MSLSARRPWLARAKNTTAALGEFTKAVPYLERRRCN